ncbi:CHASE domain-containing protein [Massilia sp. Leaf139]|uniref:CHASE domain-containing protein n=1 Tax=Massilia sp. Leaf139 TaxID=1736272 RepID=UPI0006F8635B|nr:CHASE domain-containing protein [Massilia sp. Leaf139]KQQ87749.1 diguanylate cyclase [Massilia sp. Leaf139]
MPRPDPDETTPIPGASDRQGWGPLISAGLVFLIALLITWGAWNGARRDAAADLAAQFDYRSRDLVNTTVRRMAVYEQVLRGTRGFMRGSTDIDRRDFAEYFRVQNLQEHFPGIQALGIASIIPPGRLAAHEAAMRAQGFGSYEVHPQPSGSIVTTITHIEPFTGSNLRAFGFDMYSEPVRRAAMEAARDSGAAALSGKVVLVQEGRDAQPGFLMYVPVYRKGAPVASVDERRAAIVGWVYAPFRMADLMRGLGGAHAADLQVTVYDGARADPDALLFRSQDAAAWRRPLLRLTLPATISGRPWLLDIASSPSFEARLDTRRPQVIANTGIGLGFLLALVVWLLASERRRAVRLAKAMTLELRQSYEHIDAERMRMDVILQTTYDAFVAVDAEGRITDWNRRAVQQFGYTREEALGHEVGELLVPFEERVPGERGFAQFTRNGRPLVIGEPAELMARHRDGHLVPVEIVVAALPAEAGYGASAFLRDITPRREAEAREEGRKQRLDEARMALARSQKLEAVGKLTGGVTHDFNNILHIISANVQLLMHSSKNSEKRLQNILDAVERGTKLSAQLLAFARRQPLHPSLVDIGLLLERMDSLLHRAAGDGVTISLAREDGLWPTLVDPNQLENVLLNLVINARDAMDGQGKVTIALENRTIDSDDAADDPELTPGDYVRIAVADTGEGMPPEVIERAFEPFFTTKPEGKGTGLGLSMAHGFVRQSGGHIRIASVVGQGTTIAIYLPRASAQADTANPPATPSLH